MVGLYLNPPDQGGGRGVFHNVPELLATIENYLDVNNASPETFIWTATANRSWKRSAAAGSPSTK